MSFGFEFFSQIITTTPDIGYNIGRRQTITELPNYD